MLDPVGQGVDRASALAARSDVCRNGRDGARFAGLPSLAVVVPATDGPHTLPQCLAAIRPGLAPCDELIVVREPQRLGPAAARNFGARRARADVLVFIDSDVVVHSDALARVRAAFRSDRELTAVFGSYDDDPGSPGLVSQFRNLLHHHLHQRGAGPAMTFWSGLGAVRRAEFLRLGGFDTGRFAVAAVEDIDLGMRLTADRRRVELHSDLLGSHLKQWTLASMIRTDFKHRALPWALICLERRALPRTLNLSWRERASSLATVAALVGVGVRRHRTLSASLVALGLLNLPFYRLLHRRLGVARALVGVGLHALHRLVGTAALPSAAVLYLRRRPLPPPSLIESAGGAELAHMLAHSGAPAAGLVALTPE